MRVRFFYAWVPLVVVFGTAVLLTIPYLAVIALLIVAVVLLAALAWAIVAVPLRLGRAAGRRWQSRIVASPRPVAAPVPARVQHAPVAMYGSHSAFPKEPVR